MNKTEFIARVAKNAGLENKTADAAVNAAIAVIAEALKAGEKVQITGFGTFEAREREERDGRNPRTGESIKIEASKTPAFKPGQTLKDAVNK